MWKHIPWALLLLCLHCASAQQIDTVFNSKRTAKPASLFDEIQNPKERTAFREMWQMRDPSRQRKLAEEFVEGYPRSVLLKEAYEIAARACVALGDYSRGLDWAKRALRLLPENPFLLAMVADVAAKHGQIPLAETSARDALRDLDRAVAPSPITPEAWPRVRDDLRETAYYALGRVELSRGRNAESGKWLLMALSLKPGDLDAVYLLGIVRLALHDEAEAAQCFAQTLRAGSGPFKDSARRSLQQIYDRQSGQRRSFEDYAASLEWKPPERPAPVAAQVSSNRYAGSTVCRDCHASEFENWQGTGMAKMFRPYRQSDVIGDFSGEHSILDNARAVTKDNRPAIELRDGATGRWTSYPVDFLIGSKWQQAYATKLPGGEFVVLPIQYSRIEHAWVDYWKIVDGPGSERADIANFHGLPPGALYQHDCAPCHTSQLRNPGGEDHPERASFRDGGVNCEMCHGPSLAHVESMRRGGSAAGKVSPPVNALPVDFAKIPAEQSVAICAQCHMQSAVHDADSRGAVNFSEEGSQFYRNYGVHLLSDFTRKALYADGRYRATTFIVEAFTRSRCYRQGGATCASCHNPHPANAASNLKSLKFAEDSDEMCLQCHAALRANPEKHTRHATGSTASRCVSCHMPRNMDAVLFRARSHQIDEIPDAAMTQRFGKTASPNACLDCHQDHDEAWLVRR